jgi:hypothetical protein
LSASPVGAEDLILSGALGWGARIRTWEWRNQNPLPYHLATPHHAGIAPRLQSPSGAGGP